MLASGSRTILWRQRGIFLFSVLFLGNSHTVCCSRPNTNDPNMKLKSSLVRGDSHVAVSHVVWSLYILIDAFNLTLAMHFQPRLFSALAYAQLEMMNYNIAPYYVCLSFCTPPLVHSTLGILNTNDSLIYTILTKVQNLDK